MSAALSALAGETAGLDYDGDDVTISDEAALRGGIEALAREAVFAEDADRRDAARWLIRRAGRHTGVVPASIHHYYIARGRGVAANATTPAINVRAMSFDVARAVFRASLAGDVGAVVFEIARSEIGYTAQRPAEYTAVITAAALAEGWSGPLFVQGDHFQINAGKYKADPDTERGAVETLITEAIAGGFYNIDVDTSTLVELDEPDVEKAQELNARLSAELTMFIRKAQPEGITVSVGGEIGEVGKENSTPEELRAYMNHFNTFLAEQGGVTGLSKISIQTGTSHGGVVKADGTLADVAIDFECLQALGEVARNEYGMGGAVQHGASTLPDECFDQFSKADAVEVHLATNFQNMIFDAPEFPAELKAEIYAWLDEHMAGERKADDTDEQFHYKLRKKAIGPFKRRFWDLPAEARQAIGERLEAKFSALFEKLGVNGTRAAVREATPDVEPPREALVAVTAAPDDTSLDD